MTVEKTQYAALFPGQGSQHKGMGAFVYENSPIAREIYHRASQILGLDIPEICFQDPKGQLSSPNLDTAIVQPALVTTEVATAAALREQGVAEPRFILGHSAGKLGAMMANGSMPLEVGLPLMRERGELMKRSAPGTIVGLVVGLEKQIIDAAFDSKRDQVGNFRVTVENGSELVMVGGDSSHWNFVENLLNDLRARLVRKYPDAPLSHHPVLGPAQQALNDLIHGISLPRIPLIDDLTGQVVSTVAELEASLREHLVEHISWKRGVERLLSLGITRAVEVGPSNKLQGMMKREWPILEVLTTGSAGDFAKVVQTHPA